MKMYDIKNFEKHRADGKPLWDAIYGMVAYPALLVAHDLKIFELLGDGALSVPELAGELGVTRRPLEAILSANVAMGMLDSGGAVYSLNELSRDHLLKSSPTYFGGLLDALIINDLRIPFENLKKAVLSNSSQAYGGDEIFEVHDEDMESAKIFTQAMHSISMAAALVWPDTIDLSNYRTFLDVGGGSGAHTIGALRSWSQLSGIILDIDSVCDVASEFLDQYKLNYRAHTHVGDFWNAPYPDADIHFYSQIFHDWPEDKCQFLTKKSFESLPSRGRIILHELLYNDDKSGPFSAAAASISMLMWTEGRQYSGKELTHMLSEAGFSDITINPAYGDWSVVSGVKK